MDTVTIALAKGRLGEKTMDILEGCGVDCSSVRDAGRKLVFDNGEGYKFLLVKPSDVPTYVHHGVADIGVVGKDTLLEANRPLYEMLDLKFGQCALCIAGPADCAQHRPDRILRIATKYPNIALNYFNSKGRSVEIIKLNGSVELGPLVGLSEVIVDIVESGKTLRENGLEVLEDICELSARLVVNRVSLKMHRERILKLMTEIKAELERERS